MSAPAQSELDRLAAELSREVRHAASTRANAELVAAFHGMTRELESAVAEIDQCSALLRGPSPLALPESYPDQFQPRTDWILAQIDKVRATVETDPMRVRQGTLWRESQRAFNTLRSELIELVDSAYSGLMDTFAGDDRQVLESLPPGITGVRDYRMAVEDFERMATAICGGRATSGGCRPPAQESSRQGRGRGSARGVPGPMAAGPDGRFALGGVTDAFVAWLRERGLSGSTVLTYRTR